MDDLSTGMIGSCAAGSCSLLALWRLALLTSKASTAVRQAVARISLQAARYESGLDGSPMYDGEYFDGISNATHGDISCSCTMWACLPCLSRNATRWPSLRRYGRGDAIAAELKARGDSCSEDRRDTMGSGAGNIFQPFPRLILPTDLAHIILRHAGACANRCAGTRDGAGLAHKCQPLLHLRSLRPPTRTRATGDCPALAPTTRRFRRSACGATFGGNGPAHTGRCRSMTMCPRYAPHARP